MKNPELFHKTVGILVKAFMNNTLVHTNCYACAVGNLIAHYEGRKFIPVANDPALLGYKVVWDTEEHGSYNPKNMPWINSVKNRKQAIRQTEITGYTLDQILDIEFAFEHSENVAESFDNDESGYLGLMAVIDVLSQIHEATEQEASEAKELFVLAS